MSENLFKDLQEQLQNSFEKHVKVVELPVRAKILEIRNNHPIRLYIKTRTSKAKTASWGPSKRWLSRLEDEQIPWFLVLLDRNYFQGYLLPPSYVKQKRRPPPFGWAYVSKDNSYKIHTSESQLDPKYRFDNFESFLYRILTSNEVGDNDSVVEQAAHTIESDPVSTSDGLDKIWAAIRLRRGQQKFRTEVLDAYERRCAITGCDAEAALEAAHIIPYKDDQTNDLGNGLLLRADIHTLFDLGLLAIDTTNMTVIISRELANTMYSNLQGKHLAARPEVLVNITPALDKKRELYFVDSSRNNL